MPAFLLAITAVLLMAAAIVFTYFNEGESLRLTCTPAYTVCNRWYDSDGRVHNLSTETVSQFQAFQTAFQEAPPSGSCLVIRTKRLGVTAYTGGKTLYSADAQNGTAYHFIPVDELDSTHTVVLHLTPYRRKTGSITGDVRLCSKNEYLLCMLDKNKPFIAAILALITLCAVSLGIAAGKFLSKKRSGFADLYLTFFLALAAVFTLFSCDLGAVLVGSPACVQLLKYTSLLLAPIPLGAFLFHLKVQNRKMKAKS